MKIDFDKIIKENSTSFIEEFGKYRSYREEDVKKMLRQACIQVLDEATRRAKATYYVDCDLEIISRVDKQSILQIKEEL